MNDDAPLLIFCGTWFAVSFGSMYSEDKFRQARKRTRFFKCVLSMCTHPYASIFDALLCGRAAGGQRSGDRHRVDGDRGPKRRRQQQKRRADCLLEKRDILRLVTSMRLIPAFVLCATPPPAPMPGEQVVSSRLIHGSMKPVVKIGGLVDGVNIRSANRVRVGGGRQHQVSR